MGKARKMNGVLASRLRAIEDELHGVRQVTKKLERGTADIENAPFYLTRQPAENAMGGASESVAAQDAVRSQPRDAEAGTRETDTSEGVAGGSFVRQAPPVKNNEKFASYFMVGSLHGVPPLSKEIKKVRNRAIFLSVVAFFILVWLLWFIF